MLPGAEGSVTDVGAGGVVAVGGGGGVVAGGDGVVAGGSVGGVVGVGGLAVSVGLTGDSLDGVDVAVGSGSEIGLLAAWPSSELAVSDGVGSGCELAIPASPSVGSGPLHAPRTISVIRIANAGMYVRRAFISGK